MAGWPGPDDAATGREDFRRDGAPASAVGERAPSPPLRALRAHPLFAAAVLLATLAGSIAWLSLRSPSYTAKAELLVTPLRSDDPDRLTLPLLQDSSGDPIRTMQTAAALVDSQQAASLTARRLGGDRTAKSVRDAVDVKPQGQTSILDVTAVGESPQEAARVANAFAKAIIDSRTALLRPLVASALQTTRSQLRGLRAGADATELERRLARLEELRGGRDPTIAISQRAVASDKATGLGAPLVVAVALLAGGLLALGLVPLMDMVGPRRILTDDELLGIYPLPVLSRVPTLPARRRVAPDRLTLNPVVWEAFRSLQVQLELDGDGTPVTMFTSPSRADGKTSSAIDFALQLADTGSQVIVLDLDLRKPDVAARLGMTPTPPTASAGKRRGKVVPYTLRSVFGHPTLNVIEGRTLPGLGNDTRDAPERIASLLEELCLKADHVIVDVPPLGEVSDPLLLVSLVTDIVLVVRLGHTHTAGAETVRSLLARAGVEPTGYLVIGGENASGGYYYQGSESARGAGT